MRITVAFGNNFEGNRIIRPGVELGSIADQFITVCPCFRLYSVVGLPVQHKTRGLQMRRLSFGIQPVMCFIVRILRGALILAQGPGSV
jgi:hypothetical protein